MEGEEKGGGGMGRTRVGSYERTRSRMPSSSWDWRGVEKHFCYQVLSFASLDIE